MVNETYGLACMRTEVYGVKQKPGKPTNNNNNNHHHHHHHHQRRAFLIYFNHIYLLFICKDTYLYIIFQFLYKYVRMSNFSVIMYYIFSLYALIGYGLPPNQGL